MNSHPRVAVPFMGRKLKETHYSLSLSGNYPDDFMLSGELIYGSATIWHSYILFLSQNNQLKTESYGKLLL